MKINKNDEDIIFSLAEEITGSCQQGKFRREILVPNVERRMTKNNILKFDDYYQFAKRNPAEWSHFVSALTIHTTSWFREEPHYLEFEKTAIQFAKKNTDKVFRCWSAACSTGEEAYSAALMLRNIQIQYPEFKFEIYGSDIDPVSVQFASKAIYSVENLNSIPNRFYPFILKGSGKTEGLFTFEKSLREKLFFNTHSLTQSEPLKENLTFDWIFCRNVLIYFSKDEVKKIINHLLKNLNQNGILCLGHSEALDSIPANTMSLGRACYQKNTNKLNLVKTKEKEHTILIIDDSPVIRKLLRKIFESHHCNVIESESGLVADQKIQETHIDLITLDLNMFPEDGVTWLKRFRKNDEKTPVIIISDSDPKEADSVFGALSAGAQEYIVKSNLNKDVEQFYENIKVFLKKEDSTQTLKKNENVERLKSNILLPFKPEVILIGASTGGPEALSSVLKNIGHSELPPVVIVQHIISTFSEPFSKRLAEISKLKFSQSRPGEILKKGHLYFSVTDEHIGIEKSGNDIKVKFSDDPKLFGHRPAVDYLFSTAAKANVKSFSLLLTGMGKDGANGLKLIHNNKNSITIAQDEESSVVFGMPKEAILLDAVNYIGNLEELHLFLKKLNS